ncbi:Transposon Tf2-8 polyprotein [Smittium mucronatum]|uniref:Transposon Tf2-8 polyprotein n=1 Tax=Smittium mucronatum TaxID=133383 RepID=A0A1R0H7M7_9FUNG|nr:Transposon Tf2-8 polyprotein [Smittium mucronatum]
MIPSGLNPTEILKEHIKELYQSGYARPSSSPYSANPLIVPKSDGSPRVVINFRQLDKLTIIDEYPVPRIDHLKHLRNVLQKLESKRFKLNSKKSLFAVPKVDIIFFTVSENDQEINLEKTKAFKCFPKPKSVTNVRRFLGMTSFCPNFINNFTELAEQMYKLLEKETEFEWENDCDKSFKKLITAMISAPVLAHPETTKSYVMYTDASNIGIGASLHQTQTDGTVRPIAYASRKPIAAEINYCTSEKEELAVVYGFDKFHHYVHVSCTELHTDHRAL